MAGRTTKEVIKELKAELKHQVARFPAFDAGLGQPAHNVYIHCNGMWLMQIISKLLTPKGSPRRPNSKVQQRFGKLLVSAGVVRKYQPAGESKGKRQTDQEAVVALMKELSAKLDSGPISPPKQNWLSPPEFKAATKCRSVWMIREWCRLGKVRCKKLDPSNPKSSWLVLATEVDRYLADGGFHEVVQQPA
jgi:hypothetical protein